MKLEIRFNGSKLIVDFFPAALSKEYNATSGEAGYQRAENQNIKDKGPTPAGIYTFLLKKATTEAKVSKVSSSLYTCEYPSQVSTKTRGWQSLSPIISDSMGIDKAKCNKRINEWGSNRIWIEPDDATRKRIETMQRLPDSFYIHDSTRQETQGCIEVDPTFFKNLGIFLNADNARNSNKTVTLIVEYASPNTVTTHNEIPKPVSEHLKRK